MNVWMGMVQVRHAAAKVSRRLAGERGFTLIETLVVVAILLIVLGALVDGFASVSKAEVDQTNRASDQQAARQALDRMRKDIHCASGASRLPDRRPGDAVPQDAWLLNLQIPNAVLQRRHGRGFRRDGCPVVHGAGQRQHHSLRAVQDDRHAGRYDLRCGECQLPGRLPDAFTGLDVPPADMRCRSGSDGRGRHARQPRLPEATRAAPTSCKTRSRCATRLRARRPDARESVAAPARRRAARPEPPARPSRSRSTVRQSNCVRAICQLARGQRSSARLSFHDARCSGPRAASTAAA